MGYELVLGGAVKKKIGRFDSDLQKKILKKIRKLKDTPHTGKPLRLDLKGKRTLRVALRYRVVYSVDDKKKVVRIEGIGHRDIIYS